MHLLAGCYPATHVYVRIHTLFPHSSRMPQHLGPVLEPITYTTIITIVGCSVSRLVHLSSQLLLNLLYFVFFFIKWFINPLVIEIEKKIILYDEEDVHEIKPHSIYPSPFPASEHITSHLKQFFSIWMLCICFYI